MIANNFNAPPFQGYSHESYDMLKCRFFVMFVTFSVCILLKSYCFQRS